MVINIVAKRDGKWYVLSEDGSKILGGPYDTKAEAVKRLRQIEYFKNNKEAGQMEFITTNLTGMVRNDTMEGREYLVVPMIMMVEGVLNGSNGPLYYPAEELEKVPQVWNHKPIVVYHPEMNGRALSACDPDIITNRKIGVIMNTTFDGKKLKAEAWLEPDRVAAVDERISEALEQNKMMEVSTGLFTENEEAEGEFNGKPYKAIARNYRPDHLAILPDQIGACSIADGAGLLRTNARGYLPTIEKALKYLGVNELSHSDLRDQLFSAIQSKETPNNPVWIADVYDNYMVYELGGKYYKQSYLVDDSDQVKLVDSPAEVKREIVYSTLQSNKENEMNKEEKVAEIIKNTAWTDEDKDFLMGLEDNQLDKMLPVKNEEPEEKPEENKGEGEPEEKPAEQAPEQNKEETAEEFIAKAPAELREVLKDSLQTHAQKKAGLIEKIVANEKNIFTKEQLSSMSVNELNAIAALAAVEEKKPTGAANYFGQAPVGNAAESKEEPLVAPTLNFGEEK
ncbi:MAG: hypothetical protein DRN14_03850 [Thermoplasmata archaeon]|nr:MAG: hypothetical protein DRN14_03850 [Thermoplasmata archaeon]